MEVATRRFFKARAVNIEAAGLFSVRHNLSLVFFELVDNSWTLIPTYYVPTKVISLFRHLAESHSPRELEEAVAEYFNGETWEVDGSDVQFRRKHEEPVSI
jgi:hypothetical protein